MDNLAATILREARRAGFQVDPDGDSLRVSGPGNRADILDSIRAHKAEIVEAFRSTPRGVDHYRHRMRAGVDWLGASFKRLVDLPPNAGGREAEVDNFGKNLDTWHRLDEELRRLYPEFRGCPIGGCEPAAPVR